MPRHHRGRGRYSTKDLAALVGLTPASTKVTLHRQGISITDFPAVVEFVVQRRLKELKDAAKTQDVPGGVEPGDPHLPEDVG